MATKDAKAAAADIGGMVDQLEKPEELGAITARAILDAAQLAARRRPTPQAPMVAAGFRVDNTAIRGPSGTLGEITMGAEFGSTEFRQFGGRHGGGSWLFPAVANPPPAVTTDQEDWLDGILNG